MIVGALTLMVISMMEIGWFEEVKRRYMLASPNVTSILLTYNLSNTNSCNVHPKKDAFGKCCGTQQMKTFLGLDSSLGRPLLQSGTGVPTRSSCRGS